MTEQDDRTDNEKQVQKERENLIDRYGSLEETPLTDIEHFENYRAALQEKHTRNELKSALTNELDMCLQYVNSEYDVIDEHEEFDFSDTDYLSERQLAQMTAMTHSIHMISYRFKSALTIKEQLYKNRVENSYLKPTVWIKRKLQTLKERFNQ